MKYPSINRILELSSYGLIILEVWFSTTWQS